MTTTPSSRRAALAAVTALIASLLTLAGGRGATAAVPGWVDHTYGTGGLTLVTDTQQAVTPPLRRAMVLDSQGRALVTGFRVAGTVRTTTLTRLTADGLPDQTWGAGGRIDVPTPDSSQTWATVGPDDGVAMVAVRSPARSLLVWRWTSAGQPVPGFGPLEITAGGPYVRPVTTMQPDGALVVLATTQRGTAGTTFDRTIGLRITAAGALDPTFAAAGPEPGFFLTPQQFVPVDARAVISDASGTIAAGVGVIRITPAGTLDTGFGTAGRAGGLPAVADLSLLPAPGGGYLYSGTSNSLGQLRRAVFKIGPNGAPDTAFGVAGSAVNPATDCTSGGAVLPTAAAVGADAIYVAGQACGTTGSSVVIRFFLDGRPDPAFGVAGRLPLSVLGQGASALWVSGLGVQPGGRVLAAFGAGGTAVAVTAVNRTRAAAVPGAFVPITPARMVDTRFAVGTFAGALPANGVRDLRLAGAAGIPADAAAVLLSAKVVGGTATGSLTLWAAGATRPATSTLAWAAGRTVGNTAVVALGTGGSITARNNGTGTVHLLLDVLGYYAGGASTLPGTLQQVTPTRVLDTRTGLGGPAGPLGANGTRPLPVTARTGVPATVKAVVLNVTAANGTGTGTVSASGAGTVLTLLPGRLTSGFATAVPDAAGAVTFTHAGAGTTHLLVEVVGYYRAGTSTAIGSYVPVTPIRLDQTGFVLQQAVPTGITSTAPGRTGAVLLQVTAAPPAASGRLTVVDPLAADSARRPQPTSTLQLTASEGVTGATALTVNGTDGALVVTPTTATSAVRVELVGYFRD